MMRWMTCLGLIWVAGWCVACDEVADRLEVGTCLEDHHCPHPLRCIQDARGVLGHCGCEGGATDGDGAASISLLCPGTQTCSNETERCVCQHDVQCPLSQKCVDGECRCESAADCNGDPADGSGLACGCEDGQCVLPPEAFDPLGNGASGLCTVWSADRAARNACGGRGELMHPVGESCGPGGATWQCVGCDVVSCCLPDATRTASCCRPQDDQLACTMDEWPGGSCFDPDLQTVDLCGAIVDRGSPGACSSESIEGAPCFIGARLPECGDDRGPPDGTWSCRAPTSDAPGESDRDEMERDEPGIESPCVPAMREVDPNPDDVRSAGLVAECVPRIQGNICGGQGDLTRCADFELVNDEARDQGLEPGDACCLTDPAEPGECIDEACTGIVTCVSADGVTCDVPDLNPCGSCGPLVVLSRRACGPEQNVVECQRVLDEMCWDKDENGQRRPKTPEDAPECFCLWGDVDGGGSGAIPHCQGIGDVLGVVDQATGAFVEGAPCGACDTYEGQFRCFDGLVAACDSPAPNDCGTCGALKVIHSTVGDGGPRRLGERCRTSGDEPQEGRLRCTAERDALDCEPFTCLPGEEQAAASGLAGFDVLVGEPCDRAQVDRLATQRRSWQDGAWDVDRWVRCHDAWLRQAAARDEEGGERDWPPYTCDPPHSRPLTLGLGDQATWDDWHACHQRWRQGVPGHDEPRRRGPVPEYDCLGGGDDLRASIPTGSPPPTVSAMGGGGGCNDGIWRCQRGGLVCQLRAANCCGGCQPLVAEHACDIDEGSHPMCIIEDGEWTVICAVDADDDGLAVCVGPAGGEPCPAACDDGEDGRCIPSRAPACVDWLGPEVVRLFDINERVPCGSGQGAQCCPDPDGPGPGDGCPPDTEQTRWNCEAAPPGPGGEPWRQCIPYALERPE